MQPELPRTPILVLGDTQLVSPWERRLLRRENNRVEQRRLLAQG